MKSCFNICLLIVFTKLAIAQELPFAEMERAKKEASLAVSEGNLQKALESYAALADEYPTNLEVANDVAVILAGLGRLNEARQVLEVAGVKDILAKSLGSPTHLNVAKATIDGLLSQRTPDSVAKLRGKKAEEVAPAGLVQAYERTKAEKKVMAIDES